MDSASPIAMCIAGRPTVSAGMNFTFANGTTKAETVATRWLSLRNSGGYRDSHHRTYGEGPLA